MLESNNLFLWRSFMFLRNANEELDIHPSPGKIVRQPLAKGNRQKEQISGKKNVNTCHTAAVSIWKNGSTAHI